MNTSSNNYKLRHDPNYNMVNPNSVSMKVLEVCRDLVDRLDLTISTAKADDVAIQFLYPLTPASGPRNALKFLSQKAHAELAKDKVEFFHPDNEGYIPEGDFCFAMPIRIPNDSLVLLFSTRVSFQKSCGLLFDRRLFDTMSDEEVVAYAKEELGLSDLFK